MKRYTKLWLSFAKNSLIREMGFKANFLVKVTLEIGWAFATIFMFEIIFYQTNTIAGWKKGEIYLIYSLFRIVSAIGSIIYRKNLSRLSHLINSGEFDYYLTKPVNIFFLSNTRYVSLDRISQTLVGIGIYLYALTFPEVPNTPKTLLLTLFFIPLGILIRFSLNVIIHLPVFLSEKLENIYRLELTFFSIARYPRGVFPPFLVKIFTFLIPVLAVAALPAEIILSKSPQYWILILLTIAITLFTISYKLFNLALRSYTSASS